MTMWVETHFPWYVWDDEVEEDWSILDKKGLVEKEEFKKRYRLPPAYLSRPLQGAVQEQSKVTFMSKALRIDSALK